ncbi:craniofacial development protein 2-like [Schistocerca piceifrons]|uniref:craniofacial development protein 2-like n=1 Tax=Schistocerca piceifrons TaxID=274613 RepID=UPI001F5EA384|nr:craniofacial development protein 2-like [Schistocerca piceifrons]
MRWQPHQDTQGLWADNPHHQKTHMTETKRRNSQMDLKDMTFGLKRKTRIGFWNVRMLREAGWLRQVQKEMENYQLDILGLSEVSKKSLLEWKPVSEWIITVRFKTNVRYVTVIKCYAPTEIAKGELKDAFYTELHGVLRQTNSRDIKMLMGDLNAKVGPENEGLQHIMGMHGMGIRNVNGELLIDTCAEHDLVIGGTLFPNHNCHKIMWVSPDHITKNQIDHIVISRKFRHSLLDVRNRRGADVGSDHQLVLVEFRLKIVANRTKLNHRCKKIDVARLKDQQIKETFALELKNRFQVLSEENLMEEGI